LPDLSTYGKWLLFAGLIFAALGALLWAAGKVPFLGHLPGDLRFEGGNFKFYFPLVTCVVLSLVGSLILWVISKFK
jgi:hypothetical protein